jgi:uncharacterized membrane protein YoaK (UPF0700 family)
VRDAGWNGRTGRLLALTAATGIVDAVAFLGLGQVFCAMQTGNVVFLGLGIADAGGAPPIAAPLTAICAYVAGGVAAALLLRGGAGVRAAGDARGAEAESAAGARTAVAAEIALLVLATVAAAAFAPRSGEDAALAIVAALAAAMALRTAVVRRRGGANVATTVLNLTAIGGAASAGDGVAGGADVALRAAALAALLLGAVAGALLLDAALWVPLALATAITLATHALDR